MGNKLQSAMVSGMQVDEEAFLNAFQINMNEDELTELLMSMGSATGTTYENSKEIRLCGFCSAQAELIFIEGF